MREANLGYDLDAQFVDEAVADAAGESDQIAMRHGSRDFVIGGRTVGVHRGIARTDSADVPIRNAGQRIEALKDSRITDVVVAGENRDVPEIRLRRFGDGGNRAAVGGGGRILLTCPDHRHLAVFGMVERQLRPDGNMTNEPHLEDRAKRELGRRGRARIRVVRDRLGRGSGRGGDAELPERDVIHAETEVVLAAIILFGAARAHEHCGAEKDKERGAELHG